MSRELGVPGETLWRQRTRAFLLFGLIVFLLFGFLVRVRIQLGAALPPEHPWHWHLVGLAEDAFSAGLVAVILMMFARGPRSSALARIAFGFLVAVLSLLHLIKSEAVLLFGTAVQRDHFQMGPILQTIQRSMRGFSGLLLVGAIAALAILLWIARLLAKKARRDLVTIPRMLALVLASAVLVFGPWDVHRRELARSPLLALIDMIEEERSERSRGTAAAPPISPEELMRVRELAPVSRKFLSPDYPLAYQPGARERSAPRTPPGLKPNIVFIAVENLRSEEVGAYGSQLRGVTPHLDRLAAQGIRFENAFSVGTYTTTAEIGLWYGLPAVPGLPLLHANTEIALSGLPEILRAAGWRSFFWISSTDQTFFERDLFYEPRGFSLFDGNDFPKSDPRVNWGVSDRALARRSAAALGRLEEPFAAMILTVNNHHPYQLPSDAGPPLKGLPVARRGFVSFGETSQVVGLHSAQMIQTIHYSDQAVGDFFELAAREPWFSRTIFVITGDHGIPVVPLGRQVETTHQLSDLRFRVPLILFSPLMQGGRSVEPPMSHADLLPTLLGIAGISSPRPGLGTDLLSGATDPDRPVFSWNAHDRTVRIGTKRYVYYAIVPAGGLSASGSFADELLIDSLQDPDGRRNIAKENPSELQRFRRLARIYAEDYPRVVRSGRSGLPPGSP